MRDTKQVIVFVMMIIALATVFFNPVAGVVVLILTGLYNLIPVKKDQVGTKPWNKEQER